MLQFSVNNLNYPNNELFTYKANGDNFNFKENNSSGKNRLVLELEIYLVSACVYISNRLCTLYTVCTT